MSEVVKKKNVVTTPTMKHGGVIIIKEEVETLPLFPTNPVAPLPEQPPEAVLPELPLAPEPVLPLEPMPEVPVTPEDQIPVEPDTGLPEAMPCTCIENMALAMAYVPMQQWQRIYEDDVALARGTLFEQLDLPFLGEEVIPNGR